jgi:hypothetical protein
MILGDISEIAVLYEIIEEWSDDTWKNGLFNIIIDNKYVMKEIIASTINSELNALSFRLGRIREDSELFFLEKEKAFIEMYLRIHPENIESESDYSYSITPNEFLDYHILSVSYEGKTRFIFGKIIFDAKGYTFSNIEKIEIEEAIVSNTAIEKLIEKINEKLKKVNRRG